MTPLPLRAPSVAKRGYDIEPGVDADEVLLGWLINGKNVLFCRFDE
jgi:hypothetical protein